MSRKRGRSPGGYVRKTLSLPAELVERIERYLDGRPDLTMSSFMSAAGEDRIGRIEKRKAKR